MKKRNLIYVCIAAVFIVPAVFGCKGDEASSAPDLAAQKSPNAATPGASSVTPPTNEDRVMQGEKPSGPPIGKDGGPP